MPQKKPLPDLALGKRLPHRFLQAMPGAWKRRYLLRQSGGNRGCESFDLANLLQNTKRLLIAWPDKVEDMLVAVPAVKVLCDSLGKGGACTHLAEAGLAPFLAGLFPAAALIAWDRSSLAWHEPSVQTALASLRAFDPQTAVSFLHPFPPVLQALIKASGATLRIAVGADAAWPYANVQLACETDAPLATRYFQTLNLWRYAGLDGSERWTRIQPDASQRRAAAIKWVATGAEPENTWLYLHATSGRSLDPDLRPWLIAKIKEKQEGDFTLGLLEWNTGGVEPSGESPWKEGPCLRASSLGELLGLMDHARGIAAFQGPGLHFASLAEIRCLALLKKSEVAYDVSAYNRLFEPTWI